LAIFLPRTPATTGVCDGSLQKNPDPTSYDHGRSSGSGSDPHRPYITLRNLIPRTTRNVQRGMSDVCGLPNHLLQPDGDELSSQARDGIHLHRHNQSQPDSKSVLYALGHRLIAH